MWRRRTNIYYFSLITEDLQSDKTQRFNCVVRDKWTASSITGEALQSGAVEDAGRLEMLLVTSCCVLRAAACSSLIILRAASHTGNAALVPRNLRGAADSALSWNLQFCCYLCERAQGEISPQQASCVLFISYIENQGGLENITEMDLVNYRELKNL